MTKDNDTFQLIKVEAVNIYASVYDTEQLSVIRGSSILLKKAIEYIKDEFNDKLEAISTGASSGLFSVINPREQDAEELVKMISNQLNNNEPYCFFTFVVAQSSHDDFQTAKEILVAKQRFLQMQSLSLAPDSSLVEHNEVLQVPCALQGNRAATQSNQLPGSDSKSKISRSVKMRFEYGMKNRSRFYNEELGGNESHLISTESIGNDELSKLAFTSDIQALGNSSQYTKLTDKIAVLYLDGNSFSSIQRKTVHSIEDQKAFDECIQGFRKQFLSYLLKKFNETSEQSLCFANAKTKNDELRLETLLWGGDEMLFVVPAWMGLDLIYAFYEFSENWSYRGKPLSHAGGLVFCSSKTPISKIRSLANQLADEIKEKDFGRTGNYFDYIVLESIDYPVESSMAEFFKRLYGDGASNRYTLSPVKGWMDEEGAKAQLQKMMASLPKGQIYRLANLIVKNGFDTASHNTPEDPNARLKTLIGESAHAELTELLNTLFKQPNVEDKTQYNVNWRWMHLVELWDYLVPETKDI